MTGFEGSAIDCRILLGVVFYWAWALRQLHAARAAIGGGAFIFIFKYLTKKLQAPKYGQIIPIQKSSQNVL